MLLLAALLVQATVGQAVATCRVPNDPQQRTWSLEHATPGAWRVVFTSTTLDKPRVELPLASAAPVITPTRITLTYASANGGRSIDWSIATGPSSLDLHVNHGLEVNVERDLDPAVEQMNTDGAIAVECLIGNREPGTGSRESEPRTGSRESEPGTGNGESGTANEEAGTKRAREWMIAAGLARSVGLYESEAGRVYAVQTIGWARELTGDLKLLGIPGRFAWGVEAMPVFAQFEPSSIYGIGFAPVVWRWNFPPQRTWSAYGELSMGGMWSSEPIPENTSHGNFTAHWGGGVRLRPRGGHALLLAYRFQHFSNGNQLGSNPGVNSHVFIAGWTHRS